MHLFDYYLQCGLFSPLIRGSEECNRFLSFPFYIFLKYSLSPMQSVPFVEIIVRITSLPFIGNA